MSVSKRDSMPTKKPLLFPVDRLNREGPTIYTVSMDDRYHVTSDGEVIGIAGKILKGWMVNGYRFVKIGKRSVLVHRLVAFAFIWQPPDCDQVHHVDHDKTNNAAHNLMWVTGAQNARFAKEAGRYATRSLSRAGSTARS